MHSSAYGSTVLLHPGTYVVINCTRVRHFLAASSTTDRHTIRTRTLTKGGGVGKYNFFYIPFFFAVASAGTRLYRLTMRPRLVSQRWPACRLTAIGLRRGSGRQGSGSEDQRRLARWAVEPKIVAMDGRLD